MADVDVAPNFPKRFRLAAAEKPELDVAEPNLLDRIRMKEAERPDVLKSLIWT